jgi:hypothetical protein
MLFEDEDELPIPLCYWIHIHLVAERCIGWLCILLQKPLGRISVSLKTFARMNSFASFRPFHSTLVKRQKGLLLLSSL